jgi:hypothetical protein
MLILKGVTHATFQGRSMSLDQETIEQQLSLLATHRRTLAHLLRQKAIFGIFTPPYIAHGIDEARGNIARLIVELRTAGVTVENVPGDRPGTAPIERRAKWLRILKVFIDVGRLVRAHKESGVCFA